MDEEKKDGILNETPQEEELRAADPGPGEDTEKETPQEDTEAPQNDWNYQIPYAVAEIVWPDDPATRASYINRTAPILNLIEFHTCLGPMGQLPPTARLIIGCAAIVGGVVMIKVGQAKKEGAKDGQKKGKVLPENTTEAKDGPLPEEEKNKTNRDGSQQQKIEGTRVADVGRKWRAPS